MCLPGLFKGTSANISLPKPLELPKSGMSDAVAKARAKAAEQKGVFSNIFTTALGDSTYGMNVK